MREENLMKNVAIVDYGLGNLRSVSRGLENAGAVPCITSDPDEIAAGDGIVLPGVGAFREGMEQLGDLKAVLIGCSKTMPVLGICLGMQMLLEWSEEHGMHRGLGLVPGTVRRFPQEPGMKVPHMGWNSIVLEQPDDPLFEGFAEEEYVYFVHSYYAPPDPDVMLSSTKYIVPFASTIRCGNVYGVQFHPEKSGAVGLRLLSNFIGLL
jgi:glutamine amidotransferase